MFVPSIMVSIAYLMIVWLLQNHSTPLLLLRDCYESTVLTSFFYLLLLYLSPDPEEQKEIFRKVYRNSLDVLYILTDPRSVCLKNTIESLQGSERSRNDG